MEFKGFKLDPFQEESVNSIDSNNSVVVSAATGTGKTLIADYAIDKFLKTDKRVIYTAPIKALSNQKFRDFIDSYGKDAIGLVTGDVTINAKAQVVIMTTEVYRNMLVTEDPSIRDVSYVIFDEIHYISDIERGTVWEESIIFSPDNIRFVCLSATIPNARNFADWIQKIKNHTCDCVSYSQRAVPLTHKLYDIQEGITDVKELKESVELDKYPSYDKKNRFSRQKFNSPNHVELIKELKMAEDLPCIFFSFSRKSCEIKASETSKKLDFTTPAQKNEIIAYFNSKITDTVKDMGSVRKLKTYLTRGVGYHHAGLLPICKEIVENLFNKSLLKVLYATETFAVGINMPAKTVCFSSISKYDGISFRYLKSKEYYQMAGRAGRRGIDEFGTSIVLYDRNEHDLDSIAEITSQDSEEIISQFRISYNLVLNLINRYEWPIIEKLLQSNFGYFVKPYNIVHEFKGLEKKLKKLGYLDFEGLTDKGMTASKLYSNELIVTEMIHHDFFEILSEDQINVLIASLIYERRRADKFNTKQTKINKILDLVTTNKIVKKAIKDTNLKALYHTVHKWSTGSTFKDILKESNLLEGDIIRLFRQIIDSLQQIRRASPELGDKVTKCINKIDRDVVKVEF